MTPLRRWLVVALVVAAMVAIPVVPRLWPVGDSDVSASALLRQVQDAEGHPYSGFVQTTGTLQLPSTDQFGDIGSLLEGITRVRVWWQGDDAWRVDQIETAGETDLVHTGLQTTQYDYAKARAVTSTDPPIRLPRNADLLPPSLTRTVLSGVRSDEVTRVPAERIAGITAPGLRLDPASSQTTIDHIDLYADPASGVPLRVEVYDAADGHPAFTTSFVGFDSSRPATSLVTFQRPAGIDGGFESTLDIADAVNQYAPLQVPASAAGLARSATSSGAVGIYGSGVTRFIAIPLRDREAVPLRASLQKTVGSRLVDVGAQPYFATSQSGVASRPPRLVGTTVSSGPLTVLLTGNHSDGGWLLAGTVTVAALRAAAHDLAVGTRYVEGPR